MIEKLDSELLEIKFKLKEKESLQHKLEEVMKEHKELSLKKNTLLEQLKKEKKDVDKLEKLTFTSIWYTFIGGKSEKIRQEKNELGQVEYEYKYLNDTLDRLQKDIDYYKDRIFSINKLEKEYNNLLVEKEKTIMETSHELYEPLSKINKDIVDKENYQKEIGEAINAGKEVIYALESIKEALSKARNWGTWDIFGGGFISDMVKHSNLDKAEDNMQQLRYLLNKYTRELKDINMHISINLDISDMLRFADFFFDNIFSDMMVQSKINRALEQVDKAYNIVNNQIYQLQYEYKNLNDDIKSLKAQKQNLLSPK